MKFEDASLKAQGTYWNPMHMMGANCAKELYTAGQNDLRPLVKRLNEWCKVLASKYPLETLDHDITEADKFLGEK